MDEEKDITPVTPGHIQFVPEGEEGYMMTKEEFVHRQFDLTERAVIALEKLAERDSRLDKELSAIHRALDQNSTVIQANTEESKLLKQEVKDGSAVVNAIFKPLMRVFLYVFILIIFAILIMAGVEQAIKLPITLPGF